MRIKTYRIKLPSKRYDYKPLITLIYNHAICILKAKNKVHRESVKRADKDGIAIQGQQATQTLTRDFIEEALIISDLFNLNEYAAVELLLAGNKRAILIPQIRLLLITRN